MISQEVCDRLQNSEYCEAVGGEIDTQTHTVYVKTDGTRNPEEIIKEILNGTDYRYKRPSEVVPGMRKSGSADRRSFVITEAGMIDDILDTVRDAF